jgi:hypothetical protein
MWAACMERLASTLRCVYTSEGATSRGILGQPMQLLVPECGLEKGPNKPVTMAPMVTLTRTWRKRGPDHHSHLTRVIV